jgi:hypothetical protein
MAQRIFNRRRIGRQQISSGFESLFEESRELERVRVEHNLPSVRRWGCR